MGNCSLCKIVNGIFLSDTITNSTSEQVNQSRSTPDDNTSSTRKQVNLVPTPEDNTRNEASKNNDSNDSKTVCININNLPQNVTKAPEMLTKFLHLLFNERIFINAMELHNASNTNRIYTLYELNEYSVEYQMISNLFTGTNKSFYRIQKIDKIINPYLLLMYRIKYSEYVAKKKMINERIMFHGTSKANLDNICRNNFNWRLNGRHYGVRNGKGVNFTSVAYFATHYSDSGYDKAMIIANVLIGKSCQGSAIVSVPPGDCDTTTDHRNPPQVFVKYDDNTFYPAYIVYYGGIDPKHQEQRMTISYLPYFGW